MSKKIWRGEIFHHSDRVNLNPWTRNENCTVILDSACFPVKEAMVYLKLRERYERCVNMEKASDLGMRCKRAFDNYLAAVERMKKKASKK